MFMPEPVHSVVGLFFLFIIMDSLVLEMASLIRWMAVSGVYENDFHCASLWMEM